MVAAAAEIKTMASRGAMNSAPQFARRHGKGVRVGGLSSNHQQNLFRKALMSSANRVQVLRHAVALGCESAAFSVASSHEMCRAIDIDAPSAIKGEMLNGAKKRKLSLSTGLKMMRRKRRHQW